MLTSRSVSRKHRDGAQRVLDGLAGNEATHHITGDGHPFGGVPQPV